MQCSNLPEIHAVASGCVGFITINRASSMNALSIPMILELMRLLKEWEIDDSIKAVAIRGRAKNATDEDVASQFGHFCSGGELRFFYEKLQENTPESLAELWPFFEEEYQLDLLIANYSKPYIAFMTGVTMGGGMGISQGARLRIVTETTKIAMPETTIGLIPDVGGGYFLNQCSGPIGLYLALSGEMITGEVAVSCGLADIFIRQNRLPLIWKQLKKAKCNGCIEEVFITCKAMAQPVKEVLILSDEMCFVLSLPTVATMIDHLSGMTSIESQHFLSRLKTMSPLALELTLQYMKRTRGKTLAHVLDQDRIIVNRCFVRPDGKQSEIYEGVRAKIVHKDHAPKWNPADIHEISPALIDHFFVGV